MSTLEKTSAAEWREVGIKDIAALRRPATRRRLLDSGAVFLLALGLVAFLVGLITGIWPVALAGLGPWLLVLFDVAQRKRERKSRAK